MEILWLVIGAVGGALAAWMYFNADRKKRLARLEATLLEKIRVSEERARMEGDAHRRAAGRLSEVEADAAAAVEHIGTLTTELQALNAKRETEFREHQDVKKALANAEDISRSAIERANALASELASLREQLDSSRAADAARSSRLAELQSSNEDLAKRLGEAETARGMLEDQLKQANSERSALSEESSTRIGALHESEDDRAAEIKPTEAESAAVPTDAGDAKVEQVEETPSDAPSTDFAPVPAGSSEDDLTKIKGIGPVLRDKLHELGVTSFRQIADFTQADIERVNAVLAFPGRIERERWIEQARDMVTW